MASQSNVQERIYEMLGLILGYIGGAAVPPTLYERLLWPQRYYAAFEIKHLLWVVTMMPLGGPLHSITLDVIDKCYAFGLFDGSCLGRFLGTAFYPDTGLEYMTISNSDPKHVRNGFLVRALEVAGRKYLRADMGKPSSPFIGTGSHALRAKQCVAILNIQVYDGYNDGPVVPRETGGINPRIILGLLMSELVSLVVMVVVAAVWKSWYSVLWSVPLILKVISATFAIRHELLELPTTEGILQTFRIQSYLGWFIIRGPEHIVDQFFRHYAHPKRQYAREIVQLTVMVLSCLLYPAGLICLLWMQRGIQICWLGTQLFITIVSSHLYRYYGGESIASTVGFAGEAFARQQELMFPAWGNNVYLRCNVVSFDQYNSYEDATEACDRAFVAE